MNRLEFDRYINKTYGVTAERLFPKYPTFAAYRHPKGRKWFAVVMELAPQILGLSGTTPVTVVNLKIEPTLCDILKTKDGFHPAYHMNKEKWITVEIGESTDANELYGLLAMSHRLTSTKKDIDQKEG